MSAHTRGVIVTGAGRGLGRGVALELARSGYSVLINYRGNREAAEATAEECRRLAPEASQRFVPVQADVSSQSDRDLLVDTAFSEFDQVVSLVNNAGIAPRERADILDASEQSFHDLIHTNLQGPYFLTQAVARRWLASASDGTGEPPFRSVVFVTSISAATVSINRGDYCISKAGLAMAAELWAVRLAAENIGVYEVRPGIMETDMTSGVKEKYDRLIADGLVPQKRWGQPSDIGKAVRVLVAGDFAFSTGAVIYSDGGFNLSRL